MCDKIAPDQVNMYSRGHVRHHCSYVAFLRAELLVAAFLSSYIRIIANINTTRYLATAVLLSNTYITTISNTRV